MNAQPLSNNLIHTLFHQKNYILQYQTLKLNVQLGMKVQKLHRALAFNQSKCLSPYVKLDTHNHIKAKNKFEANFSALVNGAF